MILCLISLSLEWIRVIIRRYRQRLRENQRHKTMDNFRCIGGKERHCDDMVKEKKESRGSRLRLILIVLKGIRAIIRRYREREKSRNIAYSKMYWKR